MKYLTKIFEFILKNKLFLKNCFIIMLVSRLFSLETNNLALIGEIVAGIIIIIENFKNGIENNEE